MGSGDLGGDELGKMLASFSNLDVNVMNPSERAALVNVRVFPPGSFAVVCFFGALRFGSGITFVCDCVCMYVCMCHVAGNLHYDVMCSSFL